MNWHEHYEYRSGKLYRRYSNNKHKEGAEVGWVDKAGYVRTKFGQKMTFAHRIIWEMHNGKIENGIEIDHINGFKSDNRIENLRAISHSLNMKNKTIYANNKTGVTVVFYNEASSTYDAYITINRSRKRIGSYSTISEARHHRLVELSKNKEFTERHGK